MAAWRSAPVSAAPNIAPDRKSTIAAALLGEGAVEMPFALSRPMTSLPNAVPVRAPRSSPKFCRTRRLFVSSQSPPSSE